MNIIEIAKTHNVKYEMPVENNPGFVVFTYANALLMIEKIRYECFPIIAIEVYIKHVFSCNCVFTCKRKKDETMPMFTRRSCDEAIAYINNLSGDKNDYLFDIYICSTFENVPVEVSENTTETSDDDTGWSQKQIFLYVLGVDVIITLILYVLFPHDGFRAIVFWFLAFMGTCATGVLGFAFLFNVDSSQRLKRIGKVLIANVIMFPVIMMGLIIMLIN